MGRKTTHLVKLTNEQRDEVQRIVNSSSKQISNEVKARAKVLFHSDELGNNPLSADEAAKKAKLHRETVYQIKKQFCIEGLEATLYRKKREVPPTEPKVTGDVEAHIIAIACSSAPEGKSRWSLKMIANKVVADGVIDNVSYESVRRVLKKRGLNLT